jgi:hypothetical protein
MSGLINIFRNSLTAKDSGTGMPNSPSFSDFSMGVGSEGEKLENAVHSSLLGLFTVEG